MVVNMKPTEDEYLIFSVRLHRDQVDKIETYAELDGRPSRNNAIERLINIGLMNTPVMEDRRG